MTRKIITSSFAFFLVSLGAHAAGESRQLGPGIAYPGQNESVYVNAIGLSEGGKASAIGLWHFEPEVPQLGIAGTYGSAGLGAAYARQNSSNLFAAGFGVDLGFPLFGVSLTSRDGNGLDGDLGLAFDFNSFRLAAVGRGLAGGVDRLDFGFGVKMSQAFIELDVVKPYPLDSDVYGFSLGISVAVQEFSFVFGVDWARVAGSFSDANIFAGVDFRFTQNLAVELLYRPTPLYALVGSEWSAGLRYAF